MSRALISTILAVTLFATQASADPYWSIIQPGDCKCDGFRTYNGLLQGVPAGQSAVQACYDTPATINGHYFSGANQCLNNIFTKFTFGYFDVGDASCSSTGTDPMNWSCTQDPASSDPACQICSRRLSCDLGQIYHTC